MRVQRLVIRFDLALNDVPVDKEIVVLRRVGLLHLAVCVDVLHDLVRSVGVVLANLVQLPLMILHLLHELANVRQRRLRRLLGGNKQRHGQRAGEHYQPNGITKVYTESCPKVTWSR